MMNCVSFSCLRSVLVSLGLVFVCGLGLAQTVRLVPEKQERTEENYPEKMEGFETIVFRKETLDNLEVTLLEDGQQPVKGSMSARTNHQVKTKVMEEGSLLFVRKVWGKSTRNFNGEETKEPLEDELKDLPILIKKTKTGMKAQFESGKKATAEQQKQLSEIEKHLKGAKALQNWDADVAFYGEKARLVGETWEIDKKTLNSLYLASSMDGENAIIKFESGRLTLDRVEEIEGVNYAFLTINADVVIKDKDEESGMDILVDAKSEGKIQRDLTNFYDKISKVNFVGTTKMVLDADKFGYLLEIKGPYKMDIEYKQSLPVND